MRLIRMVLAGCWALMAGCASDVGQVEGEEHIDVARQELKLVNPGRYLIESAAYHNRFLDVQWGSNQPGTPVHTWDLNGGAAQWWNVKSGPGDSYFLMSDLGTFLDVQWGSSAPGTPVHQWTYNGEAAQQWMLTPVSVNGPITTYYICSALGNCLETPWGDQGQTVYVARFTGRSNQQWRILTTRTERLSDLSTSFWVPPHTSGDNDFDGHGPDVNINTSLHIHGATELWAYRWMRARETRSDWTTAEGMQQELIYRPRDSRYIVSIRTPTYGEMWYRDNDHADDYVFPGSGESPVVNLNHPVRHARVVGDTNGGEAGFRTGAALFFNPITIEYTTTEGVSWPQF